MCAMDVPLLFHATYMMKDLFGEFYADKYTEACPLLEWQSSSALLHTLYLNLS